MLYKAGDKVKRTIGPHQNVGEMRHGKTYIVEQVGAHTLQLVGIKGVWYCDYFELVKEENNMDTFDINDLKTGHRITLENGRQYTVLTNVIHTTRATDTVTVHYPCTQYGKGWDAISSLSSPIVQVEVPSNIQSVMLAVFGNGASRAVYTTIWEKPVLLTAEQVQRQKLQAQYIAAKTEFEELGKALGVHK